MKLEFHPEAEKEFLEAVSYYEAQLPGLGERFEAELRTAAALLLEYAEIRPLIDKDLRKLVLDRFPYYVIYTVSAGLVFILAVAHERRQPRYWEARA